MDVGATQGRACAKYLEYERSVPKYILVDRGLLVVKGMVWCLADSQGASRYYDQGLEGVKQENGALDDGQTRHIKETSLGSPWVPRASSRPCYNLSGCQRGRWVFPSEFSMVTTN